VSWVAFYAVGWHTTVTWYKNRIYKILYAMVSVVQRVKAANAQARALFINPVCKPVYKQRIINLFLNGRAESTGF
jgi:hypothetical protein